MRDERSSGPSASLALWAQGHRVEVQHAREAIDRTAGRLPVTRLSNSAPRAYAPFVIPDEWLDPSLVLPRLAVSTPEALVQKVAEVLAPAAVTDAQSIEAALLEALHGEGHSIGAGVAIPHVEMAHLTETFVCLAVLRQPLSLPAIDGRPLDVFWFTLSRPDPHEHLLLLAHLARLARSKTLLDGLRRARSPEEAAALVQAVELRHRQLPASTTARPTSAHALFVISISGEQAVDALLVDLVEQGFEDAAVLEAQSLQEAATREVPLFVGFRDLFGDPGGRRILLLEAAADRAESIIEAVRRASQEQRAKDARVTVLPIQTRWIAPRPFDAEAPGGH